MSVSPSSEHEQKIFALRKGWCSKRQLNKSSRCFIILQSAGLPRSGKNFFFQGQVNSKFLVKVIEKSEFYFQVATSFDYDLFYGQKAMSFQKISINQCEEKRIVNTLYSHSHMHGQWKLFCGQGIFLSWWVATLVSLTIPLGD